MSAILLLVFVYQFGGTKFEQLNQLMAKYQECSRLVPVKSVNQKFYKKTCNSVFSTSKAFPNLDKLTRTIPKKDGYLQVQCIAEITF